MDSRVRFGVVFLAIALLVLPGCLQNSQGPPPRKDREAEQVRVKAVLQAIPTLSGYEAASTVDWWESFVTQFSRREWGWPANAAAAAFLEKELKDAGFQAETLQFDGAPEYLGVATPLPAKFRVVHGVKAGTGNETHRLLLMSHYDVHPATIQGAYDDGSGVAVELELCKQLAKVPMNKTLECVFFDAEEMGLKASEAYAKSYTDHPPGWIYDEGFGFDMVGLNFPGREDWKLYSFIGLRRESEALVPAHVDFLTFVHYDFLAAKIGLQKSKTEIFDSTKDRNSDERSFRDVGVPIVRFAGGRHASDYPQYHKPLDTTTYVYQFACDCNDLAKGRAAFERGVDIAVKMAYYTVLAYDAFDSKKLPAV